MLPSSSRLPIRTAAAAAAALLCVALAPTAAAAHDTATAPDCADEAEAVLGLAADWAAVELVGWVLKTDCLIDAGTPRSSSLPAASAAAASGRDVVVIGGPAALPEAKLAGLMVSERLWGFDRLETMRNVLAWIDRRGGTAGESAADALAALTVAPEHTGGGYDERHYEHASSRLCETEGLDPYTELSFEPDTCEVDHIVAAREAHESGGHAWTVEQRRRFGRDAANLVASRDCVIRSKGSHDVGNWDRVTSGSCAGARLTTAGACWWATFTVEVKRAWRLTVDAAEAAALSAALDGCKPAPDPNFDDSTPDGG